jgi:hypothetical protein
MHSGTYGNLNQYSVKRYRAKMQQTGNARIAIETVQHQTTLCLMASIWIKVLYASTAGGEFVIFVR